MHTSTLVTILLLLLVCLAVVYISAMMARS